jgi:hypothetical protein
LLEDKAPVDVQLSNGTAKIITGTRNNDEPDEVIVLEVKS